MSKRNSMIAWMEISPEKWNNVIKKNRKVFFNSDPVPIAKKSYNVMVDNIMKAIEDTPDKKELREKIEHEIIKIYNVCV